MSPDLTGASALLAASPAVFGGNAAPPGLYEWAHLALYALVFLGVMQIRSWIALGLCALGMILFFAVGGPLILAAREASPGHGGWDSLGDVIYGAMLALACLSSLAVQALRLGPARDKPDGRLAIAALGFPFAPLAALGIAYAVVTLAEAL